MAEWPVLSALEESRLVDAGIGRRHVPLLLGREGPLHVTSALAAAQRLLADDALWCLTLLGGHGTGKTFAGEWFILAALQAGLGSFEGACRVVTPFGLRDASHSLSERVRLQKLRVLLIDDVGCEAVERVDHVSWMLSELVDQRWKHGRKTVITSNLPPATFKHRYGPRVTARLQAQGLCIGTAGKNLRNKGGAR